MKHLTFKSLLLLCVHIYTYILLQMVKCLQNWYAKVTGPKATFFNLLSYLPHKDKVSFNAQQYMI